ncbi:MAG: DUF4358 domain-containing protein [Oscillospiraceae bacterium]|jgi:hypothetical protein|nr:DUF4358 domain-containing protein [Oscillospiraceae bacterium]
MKKLTLLLALALVITALAGCAPKEGLGTGTIEDFYAAVEPMFDTKAMAELAYDNILRNLKIDAELVDSAKVMVPTGTNQDEFGIFIAAPGRGQDLETALNAYITRRQDAWMDEYLPEERPKIFDAEVIAHGDHILYVMATSDRRRAASKAFMDAM